MHARWLVFGGILLAGSVLVATASEVWTIALALAILGIGVGPTLVTLYSLGAARSPLGRSATVMTMLGSGVVVGQAAAAAITGVLAEGVGTGASLLMPLAASAVVVTCGILNRILTASQR
jgi:MFS family permease